MKKRSLIFFFTATLFISGQISAQKKYFTSLAFYYGDQSAEKWAEKCGDSLIKNGKFKVFSKETFDKNYSIKWLEGEMKNGKKAGTWKTYHISGLPEYVFTYVNGKKHGKEIRYHACGLPCAETNYINGRMFGVSTLKQIKDRGNEFYTWMITQITDTFPENKWSGKMIEFTEKGDTQKVMIREKGNYISEQFYVNNKPVPANKIVRGFVKEFKTNRLSLSYYDKDTITFFRQIDSLVNFSELRSLSISIDDKWKSCAEAAIKKIVNLRVTKKLKSLDVRIRSLTKLPPFIFEIDSLEGLSILASISEIPGEIQKLKQLRSLEISYSLPINLAKDLPKLTRLPRLQTLYIRNTRENKIPAFIGNFKNLLYLDLPHEPYLIKDKINPLPKEIYNIKGLRCITRYRDDIRSVINPVEFYSNLPYCFLPIYEPGN
ncbi:MAG: hypothetical protein IAF38_21725 [Bacteroidia bacterium]|nr:hypothetical protein [Bacteroidia bacterium]